MPLGSPSGPLHVSTDVLNDLHRRLDDVRWPDEVGAPWQLGTDLEYLKGLARRYCWSEPERGGHFAAMEQPAVLAAEIREFFRPLR